MTNHDISTQQTQELPHASHLAHLTKSDGQPIHLTVLSICIPVEGNNLFSQQCNVSTKSMATVSDNTHSRCILSSIIQSPISCTSTDNPTSDAQRSDYTDITQTKLPMEPRLYNYLKTIVYQHHDQLKTDAFFLMNDLSGEEFRNLLTDPEESSL